MAFSFLVSKPLALGSLLLLRGISAASPRQASDRFDVLGSVALALGLIMMLLTLNRIREVSAIWFGLLSVLAFAAFAFRESRATRPIIAVETLREQRFVLLNLVSVLVNLGAFSVWLLVPYFFARMPGYSLPATGTILATAAAGAVVAAPIGARLVGRYVSAQWLAIVGAVATGTGLLGLGLWTEQTSALLWIAALGLQGVGLGLFQLAYSDSVTAALPLSDRGVAGSLVILTRTFGTVTAASVILMIFEVFEARSNFHEAFHKTFQSSALLVFASAILLAIQRCRDQVCIKP